MSQKSYIILHFNLICSYDKIQQSFVKFDCIYTTLTGCEARRAYGLSAVCFQAISYWWIQVWPEGVRVGDVLWSSSYLCLWRWIRKICNYEIHGSKQQQFSEYQVLLQSDDCQNNIMSERKLMLSGKQECFKKKLIVHWKV